MSMLVTGSQGFIGKAFLEKVKTTYGNSLSLSTYDVKDRGHHNYNDNYEVGVLLGAWKSVPLSIEKPEKYLNDNLGSVIDYASNCNKIVFASSSSVYGDSKFAEKKEGDELHTRCLSPYALSKKHNEEVLEMYSRLYGISYNALRFFNVYGPGQTSGVIIDWINSAMSEDQIIIFGNGENSRDYTFIDDVVNAINLCAVGDVENGSYNVGAQSCITLNELAVIIQSYFPAAKIKFEKPRLGDVMCSRANSEKLREATGWEANTKLIEGIEKTIEWAKKAHLHP